MKKVFVFLKDNFWPKIDKTIKSLLIQLGITTVYVVSPVDVLPDFIGPIGLTDDLVLVVLCFVQLYLTLTSMGEKKKGKISI